MVKASSQKNANKQIAKKNEGEVDEFEEEQVEQQAYKEILEKEKEKQVKAPYEPKVRRSISNILNLQKCNFYYYYYFKTFARKKVVWD